MADTSREACSLALSTSSVRLERFHCVLCYQTIYQGLRGEVYIVPIRNTTLQVSQLRSVKWLARQRTVFQYEHELEGEDEDKHEYKDGDEESGWWRYYCSYHINDSSVRNTIRR